MVGRTAFAGDLWYSVGVSGFIYPIFGHLGLGARRLARVHQADGVSRLRRIHGRAHHRWSDSPHSAPWPSGRVSDASSLADPAGASWPAYNMTLAAVGGVILWFGWYGFNPGSTLSAMDLNGIGRVSANTTLAACGGGLSSLFFVYWRGKYWDCGITVNGFLAGLVAITCPCYWVSPSGAFILGAVAGVVCVVSIDLFEHLRIDDPVGAVSVHGVCGVWGTLSLGLFATGQFSAPGPYGVDESADVVRGLFYGGGTAQLLAQAIGSASILGATFGSSLAMMYGLKSLGALRLPEDKERLGMDVTEARRACLPGARAPHGSRPSSRSSAHAERCGMRVRRHPPPRKEISRRPPPRKDDQSSSTTGRPRYILT